MRSFLVAFSLSPDSLLRPLFPSVWPDTGLSCETQSENLTLIIVRRIVLILGGRGLDKRCEASGKVYFNFDWISQCVNIKDFELMSK